MVISFSHTWIYLRGSHLITNIYIPRLQQVKECEPDGDEQYKIFFQQTQDVYCKKISYPHDVSMVHQKDRSLQHRKHRIFGQNKKEGMEKDGVVEKVQMRANKQARGHRYRTSR